MIRMAKENQRYVPTPLTSSSKAPFFMVTFL